MRAPFFLSLISSCSSECLCTYRIHMTLRSVRWKTSSPTFHEQIDEAMRNDNPKWDQVRKRKKQIKIESIEHCVCMCVHARACVSAWVQKLVTYHPYIGYNFYPVWTEQIHLFSLFWKFIFKPTKKTLWSIDFGNRISCFSFFPYLMRNGRCHTLALFHRFTEWLRCYFAAGRVEKVIGSSCWYFSVCGWQWRGKKANYTILRATLSLSLSVSPSLSLFLFILLHQISCSFVKCHMNLQIVNIEENMRVNWNYLTDWTFHTAMISLW